MILNQVGDSLNSDLLPKKREEEEKFKMGGGRNFFLTLRQRRATGLAVEQVMRGIEFFSLHLLVGDSDIVSDDGIEHGRVLALISKI
jgi:hypothetical protein